MPTLLFRLKNVPDDEADEIRELLHDAAIEFYETSAGNWGVSFAGIWLKDETQWVEARMLLEQYGKERSTRVRAEYDQQIKEGAARTLVDVVKETPFKFIICIAVMVLVLVFSLKPFFDLALD